MKVQVNHIDRGIKGTNGTWSKLLVRIPERTEDLQEVRLTERQADVIEAMMKRIAERKMDEVLVIEFTEELEFAKVSGQVGPRTETYKSVKTGEDVVQTAVYFSMVSAEPNFRVEQRGSTGNAAELLKNL